MNREEQGGNGADEAVPRQSVEQREHEEAIHAMQEQAGTVIDFRVQPGKAVLRHVGKHGDRQIMVEVHRREYLRQMTAAETPNVEIIHDIGRIVPVDEAVFKRGQECDPCYTGDTNAQKSKTMPAKEWLESAVAMVGVHVSIECRVKDVFHELSYRSHKNILQIIRVFKFIFTLALY